MNKLIQLNKGFVAIKIIVWEVPMVLSRCLPSLFPYLPLQFVESWWPPPHALCGSKFDYASWRGQLQAWSHYLLHLDCHITYLLDQVKAPQTYGAYNVKKQ